ncbi:Mur ligase [Pseudomassariella vexata]|uniref:Dihydrofolate synthetase n=1 Tax=Pseudomassariella vexata TaxID=1141098 RepID=A0A1Y2EBC6_9PEZI|nr:Mur ligase [Pseudomassariella vexata]ORY68862.1 Mur ligase [Pseudomassariella vexata]
MIELGLARIQTLLQRTPQTWKAIHVAGTNGKGSICAYLEAMLHANNIACGRFTSPHLIDRWDCISINARAVPETKFRHFENLVKKRNEDLRVGATEFELLTATAFEIFEAEKVEVGVIEVGLGGRLDATNVLKEKAVTIISKIGFDHQAILGNTIEDIALQKAGIMQAGVPCVVDASNSEPVRLVFDSHSLQTGAPLKYVSPGPSELMKSLKSLRPHQAQNLALAHEAFRLAYPQFAESVGILVPAIRNMSWPGRLQMVDIQALTSRKEKVLLDGAHNPQSAEVLAAYVNEHLRHCASPAKQQQPLIWVLAASKGKDLGEILKLLLRPGDSVVAVEFGPVDGMPWVQPMESEEILKQCPVDVTKHDAQKDLAAALDWASKTADKSPLVIAGSLYLVSDVLRLLRGHVTSNSQDSSCPHKETI